MGCEFFPDYWVWAADVCVEATKPEKFGDLLYDGIPWLAGLIFLGFVPYLWRRYIGRQRAGSSGEFDKVLDTLLAKEAENSELRGQLQAALGAAEAEAGTGRWPAIEQALEAGDTGAAEAVLETLLGEKQSEGQASLAEAARAARHIGALAYTHDTARALGFYRKAVALDPDDAGGWNELGKLLARVGDSVGAQHAFEKVLALGNQKANKLTIASATGNLGFLAQTRGDLKAAMDFHLQSLAINKELGRKEGIACQLGNLGLIAQRSGDLKAAEDFHQRSLAIETGLGRKEGMASELSYLGVVAWESGNLDVAENFHRQSLAMNEELRRKEGVGADFGNLGLVASKRGDLKAAEDFYRQSLAIFDELAGKDGMAKALANLGVLEAERGNTDKARKYWRNALALFGEMGAQSMVEQIRRNLDQLDAESGAD